MTEQCVLYDRECIDCGECDMCDLNPEKHCDDCGLCIEDPEDYRSITIKDFYSQNITKEQLAKMEKELLKRQLAEEEKEK